MPLERRADDKGPELTGREGKISRQDNSGWPARTTPAPATASGAAGWAGYKVQLTEAWEPDLPRLVVNIEITTATTDGTAVPPVACRRLADRRLAPAGHVVDSGYVSARNSLPACPRVPQLSPCLDTGSRCFPRMRRGRLVRGRVAPGRARQ